MKYVALLRGINVGGNRKVEMSHLKSCFEKMGFENIKTYINSGNIIFESRELDKKILKVSIEAALEQTFGFTILTSIQSEDTIANICNSIPSHWHNDIEQRTDVLFLWENVDSEASLKEIKQNPEVDTLMYIPGAIIWNIHKKYYKESKMHDFIKSKIYKHMTARNVNTVRKLRELFSS